MVKKYFLLFLMPVLFWSCNEGNFSGHKATVPENNVPAPALLSYTLVNMYPHDTAAFTQGLVFYGNQLYEGTGQKGASSLRQVDYTTGAIKKNVALDAQLFGEGITIMNDSVYQLTWQDNIVLVYRLSDLKKMRTVYWNREGWGLTNDSSQLIISDGTDKLYFVNPGDFKLMKIVSVFNHLGPVNNLNELEYIDGFVYANQWETSYILKIDLVSGRVIGVLDFSDALKRFANIDYKREAVQKGAVLNGVAWDAANRHMFVTGKLWPKLLEVKLN